MKLTRPSLRYFEALKDATRRLVRLSGGGDAAAATSRVRQQEFSCYGSLSEEFAERFMPLDVIADLELALGEAVVTRQLADINSCILVPKPGGRGGKDITAWTRMTAEEFARVISGVLAALADGRITDAEAETINRSIFDLMTNLASLDEAVKAAARPQEGNDA